MKKTSLETYKESAIYVPGGFLMIALLSILFLESVGVIVLFIVPEADDWIVSLIFALAILGLLAFFLFFLLVTVSEIGDRAVAKNKNGKGEKHAKELQAENQTSYGGFDERTQRYGVRQILRWVVS